MPPSSHLAGVGWGSHCAAPRLAPHGDGQRTPRGAEGSGCAEHQAQGGHELLRTGLDVSRIPPPQMPFTVSSHTCLVFTQNAGPRRLLRCHSPASTLGHESGRDGNFELKIPLSPAHPHPHGGDPSSGHGRIHMDVPPRVPPPHQEPASPSGLILHRTASAAARGHPGIFPTVPK